MWADKIKAFTTWTLSIVAGTASMFPFAAKTNNTEACGSDLIRLSTQPAA